LGGWGHIRSAALGRVMTVRAHVSAAGQGCPRPCPERRSASACAAGSVPGVIDETQLREAGRRLAEAAPGARVILFGSHARGTAAERSDIDILVIEPEVENEALESVRLMRALRDLRLPVEVVVVSERDAAAWRDVRGSLVHAAVSEGRVLAA
jgi:predicted nucleotidyltransferase